MSKDRNLAIAEAPVSVVGACDLARVETLSFTTRSAGAFVVVTKERR